MRKPWTREYGEVVRRVPLVRHSVTRFVGWLDRVFDPSANPDEVGLVFSAPLAALRGMPARQHAKLAGFERRVDCRVVDGEIAKGATFGVLREMVGAVPRGRSIGINRGCRPPAAWVAWAAWAVWASLPAVEPSLFRMVWSSWTAARSSWTAARSSWTAVWS